MYLSRAFAQSYEHDHSFERKIRINIYHFFLTVAFHYSILLGFSTLLLDHNNIYSIVLPQFI